MAQISGNVNHSQALKQAEDYVKMERKDQAFQFLYEYIMSAKKRGQWSGVFEKIMNLFIDLAIQQEKYSTIKDGLLQYRYMSQQSNSESLQKVMEHFRDRIEAIFTTFIQKTTRHAIETVDVDNEDDLIIFCQNQPQVQLEIELKNQIRQLIETYKIILENVRLNNKLEPIFVSTVQKWVNFCREYKRKAEVKKLIDFQRTHLNKLIRGKQASGVNEQVNYKNRYQQQQEQNQNKGHSQYGQSQGGQFYSFQQQQYKNQMSIDISQPNYNNIYQNVFMIQLETLIAMGLWQEAFRTVEDIHNIKKKRKEYVKVEKNDKQKQEMIVQLKKQQAALNQQYNKHLSCIFEKSNMKHLQAFSLFCYFESVEGVEQSGQIEHLVLSVLTINKSNEKQLSSDLLTKLSNHLNNGQVNSKEEMVQLIRTNNILEHCPPPLQQLFSLLEDDFSLQKYKKHAPAILSLLQNESKYDRYIKSVMEVLMVKVIQSLSKVYRVIKLDKLQQFVHFYDLQQLQKKILLMNQKQIVQTKIDHKQNTVKFWEKENSRNPLINFIEKVAQVGQEVRSVTGRMEQEKREEETEVEALDFMSQAVQLNKSREARVAYTKNPQTFQDLQKDQLEEERKYLVQFEQKKREEEHRRQKEEESQRLTDLLQDAMLKNKQRALEEIIQLKKKQVAKINDIPIEKLDEEDLMEIDLETIQELKEKVKVIMKENVDNKNIRAFKKSDYLVRKRREEEATVLTQKMNQQELDIIGIQQGILDEHSRNLTLKAHLLKAQNFKDNYLGQLFLLKQQVYTQDLKTFKHTLDSTYKQQIITLAMAKRQEDIQQAQARKEAMLAEQAKVQEDDRKKIIQRNLNAQINNENPEEKSSLITTTGPITRSLGMQQPKMEEQQKGFSRGEQQPSQGFSRGEQQPSQGFSRGEQQPSQGISRGVGFARNNEPTQQPPSEGRKKFFSSKPAPDNTVKKEEEEPNKPTGARFVKF